MTWPEFLWGGNFARLKLRGMTELLITYIFFTPSPTKQENILGLTRFIRFFVGQPCKTSSIQRNVDCCCFPEKLTLSVKYIYFFFYSKDFDQGKLFVQYVSLTYLRDVVRVRTSASIPGIPWYYLNTIKWHFWKRNKTIFINGFSHYVNHMY